MDVISTSLGRYRLAEPVGFGPDGPVHRATPERLGAGAVALRRLELPAGPARARVRRDAETVAGLGHPGLAVVSDIVEVDDRVVLLAGTLGAHGSLEDRLLLGPLPVDEAISVLRTVADALAAAHAAGLTHGHVSAANVVFTSTGPLVTDLAQASAVGRATTPAADTRAMLALAATFVDGADRSPRAAAYRAACRWSIESEAGLDGVLAALERIDQVATAPAPPAEPEVASPPRPGRDSTAVGLAVGLSLAVGATLGAAGTLLPVVAG